MATHKKKSGRTGRPAHTFYLNGTSVPCTDAAADVRLVRTRSDIQGGTRGNVRECADAQCGIRNRKKFPHAFHGIAVFNRVAYVIDEVDPVTHQPTHAVRYLRKQHDADEIKRFDQVGAVGMQPRQIVLRAPTGTQRGGRRPPNKPGRKQKPPVGKITPRTIARRGEAKRFELANGHGFIKI